jgi:mRNA interferase HigB
MRIIARRKLVEFWTSHPRSEQQLKAWYAEAESASWVSPADVKAKYGNASILKDGRVVFNICGNEYRLVVWINYDFFTIYIRFVGTHSEYDDIDAQTI